MSGRCLDKTQDREFHRATGREDLAFITSSVGWPLRRQSMHGLFLEQHGLNLLRGG